MHGQERRQHRGQKMKWCRSVKDMHRKITTNTLFFLAGKPDSNEFMH
ncbi:hypothetical protein GJA_1969 [Janthinobacterium agaricidamnosum NBRC 102515 = DSM 9628]|uniref:Uncharacterized protein n=1 Tax=Janthinobacterium agaricidamnosum NBRC 102515 = DSM 9628 TaxID=1349767 RepID=W0V4T7_9BURK|nr:hypothetical protein GJA_1969 [Janthinobacterium agaricidamnosum NBRC 102515 = DSM 9628]